MGNHGLSGSCLLKVPSGGFLALAVLFSNYLLLRLPLPQVKVGKTFQLLTADKNKKSLKEGKEKTTSSCRPDITHQCLLMLLDSPLNRAGKLQV